MKAFICVILLGLFAQSAFSSAGTNTIAAAGFANAVTPDTIFALSNATTDAIWGSSTGTVGTTLVNPNYIVFGAGLTNDTIYCWGLLTATTTYTGIEKRTINATIAAYGNDSSEAAIAKTPGDVQAKLGTAATLAGTTIALATGGGYVAVATVQQNSAATAPTYNDALVVYVYSGSASSLAASSVTVLAQTAGASGAAYTIAIATNAMWYQDGVFYILYETAGTTSLSGLFLQAITAASPANVYTSTLASLTASTATVTPRTAITMALGMPTNYTGSTNNLVTFKNPTSMEIYTCTAPLKTGVATCSGISAFTDTTYSSAKTDGNAYFPAGFIQSNGTYGVAVSYGNAYQSSTEAFAPNVTLYLNGTMTTNYTTNVTFASALTPSTAPTSAPILLTGFNYGAGYGVLFQWKTATGTPATYAYGYQLYNATGYNQSASMTSIGSLQSFSPLCVFADSYGAIWIGYTTSDATTSPYWAVNGYVGKLITQTNYTLMSTSSSTSGIMTSFAASLFLFVILSLFMI